MEGESKGLVQTDANGAFVMRADSTNMGAGRGRDSIRIVSKEEFGDVSGGHVRPGSFADWFARVSIS